MTPESTEPTESPSERPLLEARGVTKRFPGVLALDRVDLSLGPGEVVAVVGENGAGKSTLMKVLAGVETPDEGELLLDGAAVAIGSARRAIDLGIALIHQELCLADNLSVGANIFLGREPTRNGLIDDREIDRAAAAALARIDADFAPTVLVETLAIGQQQSVEIAKALAQDARVLILDEPTSSLSLSETKSLFRVLRDLRAKGVCIVYISHRLGEVKELADRVVVLRDGKNAGELAKHEIEHDAMVRLMVGRDVVMEDVASTATDDVVLRVDALRTAAHPDSAVSFEVRRGEVIGVSGLVGAGRTELLETLFGITRPVAGEVRLGDERLDLRHPREAIAAGIGLVPEDRKQYGVFLEWTVRENVGIASLDEHARSGFIDDAEEASLAEEMTAALSIKVSGPTQVAGLLSGGNQQKVVLGKWLAIRPRLLLLDEPTRGIDVVARQEIYALMRRLAADGVAILFVSSEMEEVLTLSDRALVMHAGRIAGELSRAELTEEAIMRLATTDSTRENVA